MGWILYGTGSAGGLAALLAVRPLLALGCCVVAYAGLVVVSKARQ